MKRMIICALCAWLTAAGLTAQTDFRNITYQQALAAAKAEGKPVFIDFYTSWCGPCKMMARDVFPLPKVGDYFNANFVCIKLDAEKEGKEQAAKFKVTAYPTFKVISADEEEIYTVVGGNADGDAFIAGIKAGVNPELTPDKTAQRYADGDRSAELVEAYATQLYRDARETRPADKAKMAEALRAVDDYFKSLTDQQRMAAENAFVYGYNFCSKATDDKARFLVAHLGDFTGERRDEAEKTLRTLCLYRIGTVLQGMDTLSDGEVELLRNDVAAINLNQGQEQNYEATFRILDALTTGDANKYLDQLEKDFGMLDVSTRASIAMGLAPALNTNDVTTARRADKWLRSQLPALDASSIYYAATSLITFERIIQGENQH